MPTLEKIAIYVEDRCRFPRLPVEQNRELSLFDGKPLHHYATMQYAASRYYGMSGMKLDVCSAE